MTAPVFVDTNVLIDAVDRGNLKKQQAARAWRTELWKSHRGRISFQVLQEFYVNVAQRWPSAREQARAEVRDLLAWRPVAVGGTILERGWKIQDRYQLSFWDALIVAAAKPLACRYLLTDDLQTDQEVDGITVVNPFLRDPLLFCLAITRQRGACTELEAGVPRWSSFCIRRKGNSTSTETLTNR